MSVKGDSKNIEQSGVAHIKRNTPKKIKKGQPKIIMLLCRQDHVSGVVSYTGIESVLLKIKNVLIAINWDIKFPLQDKNKTKKIC